MRRAWPSGAPPWRTHVPSRSRKAVQRAWGWNPPVLPMRFFLSLSFSRLRYCPHATFIAENLCPRIIWNSREYEIKQKLFWMLNCDVECSFLWFPLTYSSVRSNRGIERYDISFSFFLFSKKEKRNYHEYAEYAVIMNMSVLFLVIFLYYTRLHETTHLEIASWIGCTYKNTHGKRAHAACESPLGRCCVSVWSPGVRGNKNACWQKSCVMCTAYETRFSLCCIFWSKLFTV